jgi:hypothetical protein
MHFKSVVKNFFNGSFSSFTSFLTDSEDISLTELEKIKKMVDQKISMKKGSDE